MNGNIRLIGILVLAMVVLASVQVVGATGEQTWYFTDEVIGTGVTADHVVISEVFYDETSTDQNEFVELYNPTSSDIDIGGWKLRHYNQAGTHQWMLTFDGGTTIASYSYYLIGQKAPLNSSDWGGTSITPDETFPSSENLQNGPGDYVVLENGDGTYIDGVRWGAKVSGDDIPDDPHYSDVSASKSIERKARTGSTVDEMKPGGYHYSWGNGQDTDDNSQDFVTKTTPGPQNSENSIEVYPTKADCATHEIDGVMSKTASGGDTVSKAISGGTGGTVLWWYPEYPARCDVSFGENAWTARVCYGNTGGVAGNLTAEVFKVAAADGTTTRLAYGSESISAGASGSVSITCVNDTSTQTIPKGDRFGVRISWDKSTPITVKYNSDDYGSYLSSPEADPGYPVPELPTLILFTTGLITLAGYVLLTRRRN